MLLSQVILVKSEKYVVGKTTATKMCLWLPLIDFRIAGARGSRDYKSTIGKSQSLLNFC